MSKWMDNVIKNFSERLVNGYNEGFLTTNQFYTFTSNMKEKVIEGKKGDSVIYTYDYKNLHFTVTTKGFYYIQDVAASEKRHRETEIKKMKERISFTK